MEILREEKTITGVAGVALLCIFLYIVPIFQEWTNSLKRMAGTTGLEPAASAVTGQRSNQLNYVPTRQINEMRNNQCLCAVHDLQTLHRLPRIAQKSAISG